MKAKVKVTRCPACRRMPHWMWRCRNCSPHATLVVAAAPTQPEALAAALAHIRTHHQPEETK